MALGKSLIRGTRALRERLEPSMAAAFRKSARDISSNVDVTALRKALNEGDVDAAVEACNLDEAFIPLRTGIEKAFEAGGKLTTAVIAREARKVLRGR